MKLSASLYAASPFDMGAEIEAVAPFVESWHIDIMDGRFAPAFGLNEHLIRSLPERTGLPLDVHIMAEDTEALLARFFLPGVRRIAFHAEHDDEIAALAGYVRRAGVSPWLALQPEVPLDSVATVLPVLDGLLLLTAPAGGGDFSQQAFDRIHAVPDGVPVTVDGQIGPAHFDELVAAGVSLAVVGRALFSGDDPSARACRLSEMAK